VPPSIRLKKAFYVGVSGASLRRSEDWRSLAAGRRERAGAALSTVLESIVLTPAVGKVRATLRIKMERPP